MTTIMPRASVAEPGPLPPRVCSPAGPACGGAWVRGRTWRGEGEIKLSAKRWLLPSYGVPSLWQARLYFCYLILPPPGPEFCIQ